MLKCLCLCCSSFYNHLLSAIRFTVLPTATMRSSTCRQKTFHQTLRNEHSSRLMVQCEVGEYVALEAFKTVNGVSPLAFQERLHQSKQRQASARGNTKRIVLLKVISETRKKTFSLKEQRLPLNWACKNKSETSILRLRFSADFNFDLTFSFFGAYSYFLL